MASNNANSANFADKPRLTEQEKKNNHIASEQKRRQAIREGFDRLAEIDLDVDPSFDDHDDECSTKRGMSFSTTAHQHVLTNFSS